MREKAAAATAHDPVVPRVEANARDAELEAANRRIAELEAAASAASETQYASETEAKADEKPASAPYVVTAVGASYAVDGIGTHIELGLCGQVIWLVESEATRLLMLSAIRAATDVDLAGEDLRAAARAAADVAQLSGPASNPYGGMIAGTTLERHAAEQIALAKSVGASAGATA